METQVDKLQVSGSSAGGVSILKEPGFWALALLGLALFHRPLFLGETFFFRDLYLYTLPIKNLLVEALRSGEPPFWNVHLHGGQPLLSDISSTVFYPSTLLYLVLPVARALTLDLVLHALASAAALYFLARRLGLGQPAAVLAAAVYGYCGYTLSQLNLYFRLLAMPYLPLMLLCWLGFLRPAGVAEERRRRWWLFAILALGVLEVLAGSAEMVALTWLTMLVIGLAQAPRRFSIGPLLRAWMLLGAGVAGLAAPQLLPLAETVRQSQRGAGLAAETVSHWSLHPLRLPELMVPGFMGRTDTIEPGDYWGGRLVDSGFPYMLSLYLGAVVLALALVAVARRGGGALPRRLVTPLGLLLLAAVLLSLGRYLPLFELFARWVPGAQLFRYPIKFLTLGILPVALLAGGGAECLALASGRRQRILLRLGWAAAAAAGLLALLWVMVPAFTEGVQTFFFGRTGARIESGLGQAWIRMAAVWLAAVLALQLHRLRPGTWLPWVLAGLVAFDLALAGRRINPTVPAGLFSAVPPAAALVAEHVGDGRFYRAPMEAPPLRTPSGDVHWFYRWTQEVLQGYLAASYLIPVIFHDDYDGLAPSRVMKLKWTLEAVPWDQRLPLLAAGAVRVLVTGDELRLPGVEKLGTIHSTGTSRRFHVYENTRAARRLELVTAYAKVASEADAVSTMLAPGFDPRQHAVVQGEVPEADLACRGAGRAVVAQRSFHHRRIEVNTECPGLLVLSEVFYPGWEVTVDGRPAILLRANVAFSAVWLKAGEHRVEWRYVPRSFRLGLLITALTLGVLIWIDRRRSVR